MVSPVVNLLGSVRVACRCSQDGRIGIWLGLAQKPVPWRMRPHAAHMNMPQSWKVFHGIYPGSVLRGTLPLERSGICRTSAVPHTLEAILIHSFHTALLPRPYNDPCPQQTMHTHLQ